MSLKTLTRLFLVVSVAAGFLTCGFESYVYLNEVEPLTDGSVARADHQFNNPDQDYSGVFQGFEVYYKFYADGVDGNLEFTLDTATILDTSTTDFVSSLVNQGYFRLFDAASANLDGANLPVSPAFSVESTERANEFTISVDVGDKIQAGERPTLTFGYAGATPMELVRYIENDTGTGFLKLEFNRADLLDINEADAEIVVDTSIYVLAFAVLCYGYQFPDGDLYSQPAFFKFEFNALNLS